MTSLFKGLRIVSFFDFGTFFLFAEESDELPVAEGKVLWDDLPVLKDVRAQKFPHTDFFNNLTAGRK